MRVLLGVDGSFYSMYAAEELARRPWGDEVLFRVVCALAPAVPLPSGIGLGALRPAARDSERAHAEAERLVTKVADVMRGRGLRVQPVVRVGDPRTVLVKEAEKWGADVLVVGSHGRTGLKRLLLGSVASYVASHAPCSVEIIRERKETRKLPGARWK